MHRAARIAAAGHGGQVLASSSTAALASIDRLRELSRVRGEVEYPVPPLAAAEALELFR